MYSLSLQPVLPGLVPTAGPAGDWCGPMRSKSRRHASIAEWPVAAVVGTAQAEILEFATAHPVEICEIATTLEQGREHARCGNEELTKGLGGGRLRAGLVEHLEILLFDVVTIAQPDASIFGTNLKSSEELLID